VESRRCELCARAVEWVTEGDGAAVHVDFLVEDSELGLAVARLAREGFVHLEEIDVFYREARFREQLSNRRHRADAHDGRIDADAHELTEDSEDGEPELLRFVFRGDDRSGRAVRERGRV